MSAGKKWLFDTWSIYDRVLDRNYMFHREIYGAVETFLRTELGGKPIRVLDLGCGSARHIAEVLRGHEVSEYVGYDLSEAALAHAQDSLAKLDCAVTLCCASLMDSLQHEEASFDLIFAGYALHHLPAQMKEIFSAGARGKLTRSGILALVDVVRDPAEDRDAWARNYCAWLRSDWNEFKPEEKDWMCDHISTSDFPWSDVELETLAKRAGFCETNSLMRLPWHGAWVMLNDE